MKSKDRVTHHGLALRIPYVTNPSIAFLMHVGMSIAQIARATNIDRRTILKYQLNQSTPPPHHQQGLTNAVSGIVQHAQDAKRLGKNSRYTHLYHDHLDTLIAWGLFIAHREKYHGPE